MEESDTTTSDNYVKMLYGDILLHDIQNISFNFLSRYGFFNGYLYI